MAAADILLLPMLDTIVEQARFPIRLGDYLGAGRAIVGSDIGAVGEILRTYECGFAAKDREEFARRLATLIDDPERRQRLGLIARRTAENELHWGQIAQHMLKLYEGLLE